MHLELFLLSRTLNWYRQNIGTAQTENMKWNTASRKPAVRKKGILSHPLFLYIVKNNLRKCTKLDIVR